MTVGQDAPERPSSLTNTALGAMGWTSLSVAFQFGTKLAVLAVLARLLTPEDFGLVALATLTVGIGRTIILGGVGQAYLREQSSDLGMENAAAAVLPFLGVMLAGATFLLREHLAALLGIPGAAQLIGAMSLAYVLLGVSTMAEYRCMKRYAFRHYALVDYLCNALIYGLVAIAFAVSGAGAWSLVYGALAGFFVRAAAFFWIDGRFWPRDAPTLSDVRRLIRTGLSFSSATATYTVANTADNFIVARVLGAESLGLYTRAYELMKYPATLYNKVVGRIALLALSDAQSDVERLSRGYFTAVTVLASAGLPLAAVLFCYSRSIISTVLGEQWVGMVVPFQVFCVCVYFRVAQRVPLAVHQAVNRMQRLNALNLAYAFAVVAFAVLGTTWGIAGVAIGVSIAIGAYFALCSGSALDSVNGGWLRFARCHFPGIVGAILTLASIFAVRTGSEIIAPDLWHENASAGMFFEMIVLLTAWLIVLRFAPSLVLGPEGVRLVHQPRLPRRLAQLRTQIVRPLRDEVRNHGQPL